MTSDNTFTTFTTFTTTNTPRRTAAHQPGSSTSTYTPLSRPPKSALASTSSASSISLPTAMDKSPGPVTPTKALLRRIHRRSSILPAGDEPPLSSSSRRTSIRPGQLRSRPSDEAATLDEDDHTNNLGHSDDEQDEEKAVWNEVEQLLDTVQLQNDRILDLDKRNRELEKELANEREKSKAAREKSDKGLTRLSAIKVEREFLSQEMILKGLQRDNEDKTLEVESLRRRLKVMTDFLALTYGEEDWQGVVAAGVGASALPAVANAAPTRSPEKDLRDPFGGGGGTASSTIARVFENASPLAKSRPAFPARLGSHALQQGGANPFAAAEGPSSPHKAPSGSGSGGARPTAASNNDDVVIPTVARLHSPITSTAKGAFDSSVGPTDYFDAVDEGGETVLGPSGGATLHPQTLSPDFDPDVLLASIESVRLLLCGFERRNAIRRTEMEDLIEQATLAEQRAETLKASAASAAA